MGVYHDSPAMLAFLGSLVSSVFVVIFETPLDVVNTRIYNQGMPSLLAWVLGPLGLLLFLAYSTLRNNLVSFVFHFVLVSSHSTLVVNSLFALFSNHLYSAR